MAVGQLYCCPVLASAALTDVRQQGRAAPVTTQGNGCARRIIPGPEAACTTEIKRSQ